MNLLIVTKDPLFKGFIHGITRRLEGITTAFSSELKDNHDNLEYVVVLGPDICDSKPEIKLHDWMRGVVLVTFEQPSFKLPRFAVPLLLPCNASEIIEAAFQAWESLSQTDDFYQDSSDESTSDKMELSDEFEFQDTLKTILVVEDSKIQRKTLVSALREEGFRVLEAQDGKQGLEKALSSPPDLIITDVEMPRMNGFELCAAARNKPILQHIPILVLTTLSQYHHVRRAFEMGATDYLVKPQKGERELFLHTLSTRVKGLLAIQGHRKKGTVIVAEDSNLTRQLVVSSLVHAGYTVHAFPDGKAAKQFLKSTKVLPDLVVTDIEMPKMDGLELTHWIKMNRRIRHIPILVLSASSSDENRRLGASLGVDAFLSKPFSQEKLLVAVEQVLIRGKLEKDKARLSVLLGKEVLDAVSKDELEPRRVELTVMFTDIAGFSKMCASMSASDVVSLLNAYFDAMVEAIERERGYINKFIGDAIMDLFADLPGLDPGPVRAVRAAIAMLDNLATFNTQRHEKEKLHTRIGINTGPVIVGLVGGKDRQDYTAIGDHVNRAQRLEGKAPPDGILISQTVYNMSKSFLAQSTEIDVQYAGTLELKGIREPIKAWKIQPRKQGGEVK